MSDRIVIRAKRIVDGTGAPPLKNGVVVIEDGVIAAVGTEAEVKIPRDTQILALPGDQTLLPGLIDSHFHPSLCWYLKDYLLLMDDPPQELFFRAIRNLNTCLRSGVTTVRCLAEKGFVDVLCRRAIEQGLIPGPRMKTCVRGFRSERGHGFLGVPVRNIEELRRGFAENVEAGADFLKFFVTGTTLSDEKMRSFMSREEVRAAVEAAHELGREVTVHAVGGEGLHDCLDAGVDCIEHGYFADGEAIAKMKERGIPLVVTSGVFFDGEAQENLHSEELRRAFCEQRPVVRECLARAVAADIEVAVGTDGMVGKLAEEVEFLTGIGVPAADAIRAATLGGARLLGIEGETGSIEAGKRADVISVVSNPIENALALRDVRLVMKDGRRLDSLLDQMEKLGARGEKDERSGVIQHGITIPPDTEG